MWNFQEEGLSVKEVLSFSVEMLALEEMNVVLLVDSLLVTEMFLAPPCSLTSSLTAVISLPLAPDIVLTTELETLFGFSASKDVS